MEIPFSTVEVSISLYYNWLDNILVINTGRANIPNPMQKCFKITSSHKKGFLPLCQSQTE